MYADDTTLFWVGECKDSIEKNLQDALNSLTNWCDKNRMVINAKKSSCMLICNRQKRIFLQNSNFNFNVCNESLSCVRNMKTLGIIIDDELSWRDLVNEVSLKLSRQIACLRQIKSCLDIKSRLLFYYSYFLPAMNYRNVVWGPCGKGLTDRIFKITEKNFKNDVCMSQMLIFY